MDLFLSAVFTLSVSPSSCTFEEPILELINFKNTEELDLSSFDDSVDFLDLIQEQITSLKRLYVTYYTYATYSLPEDYTLELFEVYIPGGVINNRLLSKILLDWNPKHAKITRWIVHKDCYKVDLRISLFIKNEDQQNL